MSDYSKSIEIAASPEQTFAFASDVANLPRYVPTTDSAASDGSGHVHVEGQAHGTTYANDGQLYVDADRRLMSWGSGESAYRGELTVAANAQGGSTVEIKLHFNPDRSHAPSTEEVESGLAQSLDRLKSAIGTA